MSLSSDHSANGNGELTSVNSINETTIPVLVVSNEVDNIKNNINGSPAGHTSKRRRVDVSASVCIEEDDVDEGHLISTNANECNAIISLVEDLTDEDESQNEVEVVSKPQISIEIEKTPSKEEDGQITVLQSNVCNPNISYPHLRENCGVNNFCIVLSQCDDTNEKYCEKCYCFVCDVASSSCLKWKADHCNASSKDVAWQEKKSKVSNTRSDGNNIIISTSPQQEGSEYIAENGLIAIPGEVERRAQPSGSIIDVLIENFQTVLRTTKKDEKVDKIKVDGDISQLCLNNTFYLEGIKLGWPFSSIMTPQRQIAIRIIKGLKQSQHVVLESPTGTGKSAAILCSVLAWQRYHKKTERPEKVPQIIYCSRTHAQTAQIIDSLRKTPYRPQMSVLGSRSKLCINRDVNHEASRTGVNDGCRIRIRNTMKARRHGYNDENSVVSENDDDVNMDDTYESNARNNRQRNSICPHYKQLEDYNTSLLTYKAFVPPANINCIQVGGERSKLGVHDIEDLVAFGKNPSLRRSIAIYRRPSEKQFAMQLVSKSKLLKVTKIHKGGAVAREGSLKEGDIVANINNHSCCTSTFKENISHLQNTPDHEPLLIDAYQGAQQSDDIPPGETAACPYYLSQLLSAHAEIVFAPYEYMLDENIRRRVNVSLDNAIVVLDEAHNIEDKLRSNGAVEFEENKLRSLLARLQHTKSQDVIWFVADLVKYLERICGQFHNDFASGKYRRSSSMYYSEEDHQVSYYGPLSGERKKSSGCARFIDEAQLKGHDFSELKLSIDKLLVILQANWERSTVFIESVGLLIKVLAALMEPEHYYISVGVRKNQNTSSSSSTWEAYFSINLLNPALLFRPLLQQCRSVILASGTLAPIDSLCAELGLKPPGLAISPSLNQSPSYRDNIPACRNNPLNDDRLQVRPEILEANHIIHMEKQLLAASIGFFSDGSQIIASKKNYRLETFQKKLGIAIASIVEGVSSGGVLVFLPNKSLIRACEQTWKNNYDESNSTMTIWDRLLKSKEEVMIEDTKNANDFDLLKQQYADTIRSQGSCILLAVYRGRMSEGMSFNDENARAVICVGIPFAPFNVDVKAKQAYNDNQRKFLSRSLLPGSEWYRQDAYRALSQALGRCIRHYKDYGTIILMDARHCRDEERRYLPKWFKGHIRNVDVKANMQDDQYHQAENNPIYGGWRGFIKEIEKFFVEAPNFVNNL